MSSNGTPQKKTAAKKTTARSSTAKQATATANARTTTAKKATPPAQKTTVPKQRTQTTTRTRVEPDPPGEIETTANDEVLDKRLRKILADRHRRRQRLALKITCYVLAAGALSSIGLTIWQLTISSPLAAAYAGLAGVFVASTGVGCTVYHYRHKNDQNT